MPRKSRGPDYLRPLHEGSLDCEGGAEDWDQINFGAKEKMSVLINIACHELGIETCTGDAMKDLIGVRCKKVEEQEEDRQRA